VCIQNKKITKLNHLLGCLRKESHQRCKLCMLTKLVFMRYLKLMLTQIAKLINNLLKLVDGWASKLLTQLMCKQNLFTRSTMLQQNLSTGKSGPWFGTLPMLTPSHLPTSYLRRRIGGLIGRCVLEVHLQFEKCVFVLHIFIWFPLYILMEVCF